jgi:hypothetical protein
MSWPQVPDTRLIPTVTYVGGGEFLERTRERRGLGLFYGHSGVGKSTSLAHHAGRLEISVMYATREGGLRRLLDSLHTLIGVPAPDTRFARQRHELLAALSEPTLVAVDDAHNLSLRLCRFLAGLASDSEGRLAVALIARATFESRLRETQDVRAATKTWMYAPAMNVEEVLAALPRYHPIWADADIPTLRRINERYAHGFFGRWAVATVHALSLRPDPASVPWSPRLAHTLIQRLKGRA